MTVTFGTPTIKLGYAVDANDCIQNIFWKRSFREELRLDASKKDPWDSSAANNIHL